jgi:hypothetical protein
VIEGKFEAAEGAETVGSSHGDFSLVVETLHNSAGKQLLSAEIVEDSSRRWRSDRAIFFMGSMRELITCRYQSSRKLPADAGEL